MPPTLRRTVPGASVGRVRRVHLASLPEAPRPVRLPLGRQHLGMMPEAIEKRGGELLVGEDLHPLAER